MANIGGPTPSPPPENNPPLPLAPTNNNDQAINRIARDQFNFLRIMQKHPEDLAKFGPNIIKQATVLKHSLSTFRAPHSTLAKLIEKLGNWFHGLGYQETSQIIKSGLQNVAQARNVFIYNLIHNLQSKQAFSAEDIASLSTFDYKECKEALEILGNISSLLAEKIKEIKHAHVANILALLKNSPLLNEVEQGTLYSLDKDDCTYILTLTRRSQMEEMRKTATLLIQQAENQVQLTLERKSPLLKSFFTACLDILKNEATPVSKGNLSANAAICYNAILKFYSDKFPRDTSYQTLKSALPGGFPELTLQEKERVRLSKLYHDHTERPDSLEGFEKIVIYCVDLIERKKEQDVQIEKTIKSPKTELQEGKVLFTEYAALQERIPWSIYYLVRIIHELDDNGWDLIQRLIQATTQDPEFITEFNIWAKSQNKGRLLPLPVPPSRASAATASRLPPEEVKLPEKILQLISRYEKEFADLKAAQEKLGAVRNLRQQGLSTNATNLWVEAQKKVENTVKELASEVIGLREEEWNSIREQLIAKTTSNQDFVKAFNNAIRASNSLRILPQKA